MQDGETTARVLVEPAIEPQDVVVEDDDDAAFGDEAFNLAPRDDAIAVHYGRRSAWALPVKSQRGRVETRDAADGKALVTDGTGARDQSLRTAAALMVVGQRVASIFPALGTLRTGRPGGRLVRRDAAGAGEGVNTGTASK